MDPNSHVPLGGMLKLENLLPAELSRPPPYCFFYQLITVVNPNQRLTTRLNCLLDSINYSTTSTTYHVLTAIVDRWHFDNIIDG